MKVGIALKDDSGIYGDVCETFVRCKHFFLADIDAGSKRVAATRIVANDKAGSDDAALTAEALTRYRVTHVISGSVSAREQEKFNNAGVRAFEYSGNVKKALNEFLAGALKDIAVIGTGKR